MLDADDDLIRFLLLGELDDVLPGHVAAHQQVGFTGNPVFGQQLFGKGEVFLGLDDLLLRAVFAAHLGVEHQNRRLERLGVRCGQLQGLQARLGAFVSDYYLHCVLPWDESVNR